MHEKTVEYVVKELGKHRSENDIIRTVVHLENVSWEEARRMVAAVKVKCKGQIARRQSPILVAIGMVTFLGGVALAAGMVIATLMGINLFFLSLPIPYLGNVIYFLTGLGMMAGAAWGSGSVILEFLTARDQEDDG
ncbi:MAG: hypothetical protein JW918_08235 [Anaerolineae bacterium]|nr:hypothetical protein [Anaerolineae bacterium]